MPEEMRLSAVLRFLLLVQTLSIYLVVVSQYLVSKDIEYMRDCRDRETCLSGCIDDNFPELPCVTRDFAINYGRNTYRHLYEWREKPGGEERVLFEFCRDTFPDPIKTATTKKRELSDERQPRTAVCFSYCRPDVESSLYLESWIDERGVNLTDRRPLNSSAECENSGKKNSLLCVDPNPQKEYCEKLEYEGELCTAEYIPWKHSLEGETDPACLHPIIVLLSCVMAIPFQNLFDLVLIFTLATIPESIQDFRANALRCASQCSH